MSNIDKYFTLVPDNYGVVKVFDKNKQQHFDKRIYRKYQTYGVVPKFDPSIQKSYMYNETCLVPELFQPVWELGQQQNYNQMIVNWYEPSDFIEPHRDCTARMKKPMMPIKVYYCCEPGTFRVLKFTHIKTSHVVVKNLNEEFGMYEISEQVNKDYRHEILPGTGRYISFTFRAIQDL